MERSEVLKKVTDILHEQFGKDVEIDENTSKQNLKAWDSLAQMRILESVENEFSIRFKSKQIIQMESMGDIVNCVMELLA